MGADCANARLQFSAPQRTALSTIVQGIGSAAAGKLDLTALGGKLMLSQTKKVVQQQLVPW